MKMILFAIAFLPIFANGAAAQTPPPRDVSTPVPLTPKWNDERDLALLFENSNDRIALARLIISECINNISLPKASRIDGLRIAGHICYRDGAPEDAKLAFSELENLSTDPRWKAESLRMLAQLSMGQGDIDTALSQFKEAWTYAILDDPEGRFYSTKSILNMICNLCDITGNHEDGLNYAQQGIHLFAQQEKAQYVYWAYRLNKTLNDNESALFNLNDLLTNHPDFKKDDDLAGLPPLLRLDVYNLQNQGWDNPSEDFIHEIIDVIYNTNFFHMPSRLTIVRKFGLFLEKRNNDEMALHIRTVLRQELEDELATNTTIDPFLKQTLFLRSSEIGLDSAKLHLKRRDFLSAAAVLDTLINSNHDLPDHIVDQATKLDDIVTQRSQEIE